MNKTVLNACSAVLVRRGGLGAMERKTLQTLPVGNMTEATASEGDTVVVGDRLKDSTTAEHSNQARDKVPVNTTTKKGKRRV